MVLVWCAVVSAVPEVCTGRNLWQPVWGFAVYLAFIMLFSFAAGLLVDFMV